MDDLTQWETELETRGQDLGRIGLALLGLILAAILVSVFLIPAIPG